MIYRTRQPASRNIALLLAFLVACTAYDCNAKAIGPDIQMLPPTPPLNTNAKCNTGNPSQILAYSGNPSGGINCMPVQVDANGSLETLGNLTSDGATTLKQGLSVGSDATVTGKLTVSSGSLTLNSVTLSASAVTQLNTLLSVINGCVAAGGGVLAVSSAGILTCTPPGP